jgi:tRNA pseudouridine38-40 synthase
MAATQRWRLDLAYRGTSFHGFARQSGVRTVAGELADALARWARLEEPPMIVCAGRTDAGVHATAQVVHVDLPIELPEGRDGPLGGSDLVRSLNRQLGGEIAVLAATRVEASFDARHSATWRRYRYLVFESEVPDPLLDGLAWRVPGPLDVRAMAQAVGVFIGSHDFRAFCRKAQGTTGAEPIIRRVTDASVEVVDPHGALDLVGGRLIRLEIQASAFCHQMVRSLTAAVVEVGRGRSNSAELVVLLRSGSREGAPQPAPPEGLCLIGVGYPDSPGAAGPGLPDAGESP